MRKIIPFAFAIILVLAGGLYMIGRGTLKNIGKTAGQKTSVQPEASISGTVSGTTGAQATPEADKVNQIPLTISSPADQSTVSAPDIVVKGITAPSADVSVNEVDVTASLDGNFRAAVTLDEGENYIVVVAVDPDGNVSEKELTITYEPPEE